MSSNGLEDITEKLLKLVAARMAESKTKAAIRLKGVTIRRRSSDYKTCGGIGSGMPLKHLRSWS